MTFYDGNYPDRLISNLYELVQLNRSDHEKISRCLEELDPIINYMDSRGFGQGRYFKQVAQEINKANKKINLYKMLKSYPVAIMTYAFGITYAGSVGYNMGHDWAVSVGFGPIGIRDSAFGGAVTASFLSFMPVLFILGNKIKENIISYWFKNSHQKHIKNIGSCLELLGSELDQIVKLSAPRIVPPSKEVSTVADEENELELPEDKIKAEKIASNLEKVGNILILYADIEGWIDNVIPLISDVTCLEETVAELREVKKAKIPVEHSLGKKEYERERTACNRAALKIKNYVKELRDGADEKNKNNGRIDKNNF